MSKEETENDIELRCIDKEVNDNDKSNALTPTINTTANDTTTTTPEKAEFEELIESFLDEHPHDNNNINSRYNHDQDEEISEVPGLGLNRGRRRIARHLNRNNDSSSAWIARTITVLAILLLGIQFISFLVKRLGK